MKFSPQQDKALQAVADWLADPDAPQVFRLFGFAGSGKTTLAKYIAENVDGKVLFAAYTGKAALVLRSKGCKDASTIHSLIYSLDDEAGGAPKFILNQDSDLKSAKLCAIDECSMVDGELGKDLLSFGKKILVLGDPEQLPPIKGAGFFTSGRPDFMLSEIHRQALDNPIIRMSMDVREGRPLFKGGYGESRVITRKEMDAPAALAADQILVGRNMTRQNYNRRVRELKGFAGQMPLVGERLVCLRNNRPKGLLNGGIWKVDEIRKETDREIEMTLAPDDAGGQKKNAAVSVLKEFFYGTADQLEWVERRDSDEFDFGYALTVHKSQGSQWDNVVLFDESRVFREDARRWLYTGITRAAQRVTVVAA